jgi:hypothetical protein
VAANPYYGLKDDSDLASTSSRFDYRLPPDVDPDLERLNGKKYYIVTSLACLKCLTFFLV